MDDLSPKNKRNSLNERVQTEETIDDEYVRDEEDENVKLVANQMKIEQRMENLYWELKDYVEMEAVPLCEKLRVHHLIEMLYPDIKRMY